MEPIDQIEKKLIENSKRESGIMSKKPDYLIFSYALVLMMAFVSLILVMNRCDVDYKNIKTLINNSQSIRIEDNGTVSICRVWGTTTQEEMKLLESNISQLNLTYNSSRINNG